MNISEFLPKLEELGVNPSKLRGQNFLVDKNILNKIIKSADVKKGELVLEVGPGFGALTEQLDKLAKKVVAVEKDNKLFDYLESQNFQNTEIIHADVLKLNEEQIKSFFSSKKYRIVANLPYNISSAFLRKFLEQEFAPQSMILMLQKEVAERMLPNSKQNSILSLSVNFYADPKILFKVSPTCFFPVPKVESVILELKNIKPKFDIEPAKLFKIIKMGFSSKRKMLLNNLKSFGSDKVKQSLNKLSLNEKIRAEELSLEQWVALTELLFESV